MDPAPRSLYLAGPTGIGKSAIALFLAEELNAEIISVDSMQVYRGMDVGTAKPLPTEQARIRHHLIDVVPPTELFNAARFVELARAAEMELQQRGKVPLFCGGTGLYFRALLKGLGAAPASDPAVRRQLESAPLPVLLQELRVRDPVFFEKIDRSNRRRVVRALEVMRLTQKPFSEQRASWAEAPGALRPIFFGLERERDDLYRRIEARVEHMFEHGLVKETERLLAQGLPSSATALQAIGYRQVLDHLEGRLSLEQTIALVKQKTRHYAKRQMTWFRRDVAIEWIRVKREDPPDAVAQRLARLYRERRAEFCSPGQTHQESPSLPR